MKIQSITILLFVFSLLMISILNANEKDEQLIFDEKAGDLRLAISQTGKIKSLTNIVTGENYIARKTESYLLECGMYDGDDNTKKLLPVSAKAEKKDNNSTTIELSYDHGIKLTVLIIPKQGWFKMELVKADPVKEVSHIVWGPYQTTMKGQIAEWLGMNRSDDFSIGLLSLEPNTDAPPRASAFFTDEGSLIQLNSYDHTRGRYLAPQRPQIYYAFNKLRNAVPLPVTVVGSAVALYGCPSGKKAELSAIEKIVLAEKMPYPKYEGVWNKYSNTGQRFSIWTYYSENNFDAYLELAKTLSAKILCQRANMMSTWGHFDINPKVYPNGLAAMREDNKEAKKNKIETTLYALTTFIKPNPDPEPYVSPIPDERLQTWKPESKLAGNISATDTTITIQNSKDVEAVIGRTRVIRVDNELIRFAKFKVDGDKILIEESQRGAFHTQATEHSNQSRTRFMVFSGYDNFYPATLDMSNECAERLGDLMIDGDFGNIILDGNESCFEAGYGAYTCNVFLKHIYDKLTKNNHEALTTIALPLTNYSWHFVTQVSWGETDQKRGFRLSVLDCRVSRQLELRRNLMPNKFGQYSEASKATAEDINWVMGLVAGWDSGLDLNLYYGELKRNPEYEQIVKHITLWEQAMSEKSLTEHQKMLLRQTDSIYKLTRKDDGGWDLKFDKRWQYDKVKILPPSVMNATPVSDGAESVKPLSIDWSWTHNPAPYNEIGLSDDLVSQADGKESSWKVTYPQYDEKGYFSGRHFQYVIRVPENAKSAVKNFRVAVNGKPIEIPVTLQPGQYLSIPHLVEIACVYDKNHQVLSETYLHGDIQKVSKGQTVTVTLSCDAVEKDATPDVIMNVRCQNGFAYHRH
ncbi:MAG: hypothetical protein LBH59_03275 [Planctomycetaceae bacterium]|nr:hypothetical protein [Planctomycetaceae bacterium]